MSSNTAPSTSRVDGKVALVTGSSRGLGRAIALELASRGASLVINYANSASAAQHVVAEIQAMGSKAVAIPANVKEPSEIAVLFDKAVAHYGHLDIVVSNSGTESFGHVSEVTPEEFDRVYSVNTRGQFFVAQQAYKHLSVGGHLVMQSSISAQAKSVPNHSLYQSSKAAVEALVRCFAVDFGNKKINVNALAPGGIKTDMYIEAARKYMPDGDSLSDTEVDKRTAAMSPLNRVGMPEDVARVAAFLCSDDGGWMNGQTLTIGGGAGY